MAKMRLGASCGRRRKLKGFASHAAHPLPALFGILLRELRAHVPLHVFPAVLPRLRVVHRMPRAVHLMQHEAHPFPVLALDGKRVQLVPRPDDLHALVLVVHV